MKIKAAVVTELDKLEVKEVELSGPQAGEVLVKMAATGVCHSDLSHINGTIPAQFPFIIGHEGAGIVEEVGEGVTKVAPGDHVILSFVPKCGECFFCLNGQPYLCKQANAVNTGRQLDGTSRITLDGQAVQAMNALGCMAEYCVCPDISVVKIEKDVPLTIGALIGCGVTTGVGAALNAAQIKPGSTVAVVGCGGVGLSVIQGAKIAGAGTIIGIDLNEDKLEMAKKFGATDVLVSDDNTVKAVKGLTGGLGADYAFEVIGNAKVMELTYALTRNGGDTIIVGLGRAKDMMSFSALAFPVRAKNLCGCMYGNSDPERDFPRMIELYQNGELNLDAMVSKIYTIDQAVQAFEDLEAGGNARGVIEY